MMQIFLIGGAGYIGTPLSKYLSEMGYRVVILDNLNYNNELNFNDDILFINDNVINIKKYKKILDNSDIILYMISPRVYNINETDIDLHTNYLNETLKLIKNQKFLFFSSCSVYGSSDLIFDENSKVNITSIYSNLKIKSEELLLKSKKNVKILRLSTLYGYSDIDRNDLLINNFIYSVLNKKIIRVYDEKSNRPNIYLYDLIKIIDKLIQMSYDDIIINIGDNSLNVSKEDIINIIKSYVNEINLSYHSESDNRNYRVNFDKLKNLINYNFTPYDVAIKNMLLL